MRVTYTDTSLATYNNVKILYTERNLQYSSECVFYSCTVELQLYLSICMLLSAIQGLIQAKLQDQHIIFYWISIRCMNPWSIYNSCILLPVTLHAFTPAIKKKKLSNIKVEHIPVTQYFQQVCSGKNKYIKGLGFQKWYTFLWHL